VIQTMCTSLTAGAFWVDRPYGTVAVPIAGLLLSKQVISNPRLKKAVGSRLSMLRKNFEVGDWSSEGARLQAAPYIISKELRHG
jgi:hypothetical protein